MGTVGEYSLNKKNNVTQGVCGGQNIGQIVETEVEKNDGKRN